MNEDGSSELPDRLDSRRQPARVHPFCRISVIEIVVAPGESLVDDAPFRLSARTTAGGSRSHRAVTTEKGPVSRAFLGADARTRTADPFITSEVLYQLSYVGAPSRVLDSE